MLLCNVRARERALSLYRTNCIVYDTDSFMKYVQLLIISNELTQKFELS